jgi:SAM-dependent methyltransferase
MDDPIVLERMRADWNERAGEDAYYYVAFGRRDQDDEEFFATATDVLRLLRGELKRMRGRDAALEIGCGPGRLMRPLSYHFREIHGVDVSDRMIWLAEERLRGTPNAHPHHSSGSDLALFPDEMFDFVYSYAVFQHIPSRDVVFQYLRESRRVLKTGGILRCQINGLPAHAKQYDTWSGVRISPADIAEFTRDHDFQLLALEQIWTQYMWITCRKMPAGWGAGLSANEAGRSRIRTISNALTGERAAPVAGPMAFLSVWVENLPDDCDLNRMTMTADGVECRLSYIGQPETDGVSQVNAALPEGLRTGLVPIELRWLGWPVCDPGWMRIVPAGPSVPRISALTDGVNLLSDNRVTSGILKVTMLEITNPEQLRITVDDREAVISDTFCVDPIAQRYEFNVDLPQGIGSGPHEVRIAVGKRPFPAMPIEVV